MATGTASTTSEPTGKREGPPDPQIIEGMSNEDYHAQRDSYSSSAIRRFINSPAEFEWEYVLRRGFFGPDPNKAFLGTGTAFHAFVLEPDKIDEQIITIPKDVLSDSGRKAGNKYKAWKESVPENVAIVDSKQLDDVMFMVEAAKGHPLLGPLLEAEGHAERSIFWTDPQSELRLRVRPDKEIGDDIILDLKTADDPNEWWIKHAASLGYHLQDVMYCDGVMRAQGRSEYPTFIFGVVQSRAPYTCRVYQTKLDSKVEAEAVYRTALSELAECLETGEFLERGENEISDFELPRYMRRRQL